MLELFHALAESDSAAARREVSTRGLDDRVTLRNIHFDSHRDAFEQRGGTRTPALWDGATLHQGLDAVLAALAAVG